MLSAFERLIAMRYLRAKRREGFISVIAWFSLLGIMLGVATLIVVMSVMNGFRHDLLSRILGLSGHISITASSQLQGIEGFDDVVGRLAGVNGVVAVTPLLQGQVMVSANGVANGAQVRGMRGADIAARPTLRDAVRGEGALQAFDEGGVLLGIRMAERMGLRPGDQITLVSPEGEYTAFGTIPLVRSYPVAGFFEVGMYEYDRNILFMPLREAQGFFSLPGRVNEIELLLTEADQAFGRLGDVYAALGDGFRVRSWQQVNSALFSALQVERNVMFLILTLIILVAAFNVISSQIMLVNDKARGIAILRAMGASRGAIMRIFFMTGSSVGVIGACAGVVLGTAFAANIETIRQWLQGLSGVELFSAEIYYLSKLPALIEPREVMLVAGIALALSFLAAVYPAWRAARLDPVEILRYE